MSGPVEQGSSADESRMRTANAGIMLLLLLPVMTVAGPPAHGDALRPQYLNYPNVCLVAPGERESIPPRLWVSADGGRTWQWSPELDDSESAYDRPSTPIKPVTSAFHEICFQAPRDGRYALCLMPADQMPDEQTLPVASVIVDTTPPTLQIQSLECVVEGASETWLAGRLILIEEHLSAQGVRLFYRAPGARTWTDGGPVARTAGQFRWRIPAAAPARADIRIVATDLAGNQTGSQRPAVSLRGIRPAAAVAATTQPADDAQRGGADAPSAIPDIPAPPALDANALERFRRAAELQRLARAFQQEGRNDLAAARFADAATLRSDDAALLAEWGRALLEIDSIDDAERRFADALRVHAGQLEALEGLGEVAIRRGNYREAFELLRRLADDAPDSASLWLRIGDAAGRAGDNAEARRAWRRAAETAPPDSTVKASAERRLRLVSPHAD